jgi:hypothetical protein
MFSGGVIMILRNLIVLLLALLAPVIARADAISEPCPDYCTHRDAFFVRDFMIEVCYDSLMICSTLKIYRGSELQYTQYGSRYFFLEEPISGFLDESSELKAVDLTGDGYPDPVIVELTGGAHCCFTAYVFQLEPEVRLLQSFSGGDTKASPVDINGDGVFEIRTYDTSFVSWPSGFAGSPFPQIIYSWTGSQFEMDVSLTFKNPPLLSELMLDADRIRFDEDLWKGVGDLYVPVELYTTFLDLVYSGNSDVAFIFLMRAWNENIPFALKPWKEMAERMKQSEKWSELRTRADLLLKAQNR